MARKRSLKFHVAWPNAAMFWIVEPKLALPLGKVSVETPGAVEHGNSPGEIAGSVVAVQTEVSLAELYEGQPHAGDVDVFLKAAGFELWDVIPGFRDPATMRLLQYDAIYVRG